ncbi:hypothetical protein BH20ACT23_BH20ACT23_25710 [soil metagenome]
MTDRRSMVLAWSLAFVSALMSGAAYALQSNSGPNPFIQGEGGSSVLNLITSLLVTPIGSFVAARRPRNPLGWILCAVGLCNALSWFAGWYAAYGITTEPGSLIAPRLAVWFGSWAWVPLLTLPGTFLFLLFPNGHLPFPRWHWFARVVAALIAGIILVSMFTPWDALGFPLRNPIGLGFLGPIAEGLVGALLVTVGLSMVVCLTSLLVRFRGSKGALRQQLKCVGFGALMLGSGIALDFVLPEPLDLLAVGVGTVAFMASFVFAILRYRLYDIDRIISRTLAYGLVSAILIGAYLLAVLALQSVLPLNDDSPAIVAASTLAVVAAFGP